MIFLNLQYMSFEFSRFFLTFYLSNSELFINYSGLLFKLQCYFLTFNFNNLLFIYIFFKDMTFEFTELYFGLSFYSNHNYTFYYSVEVR